MTAIRLIDWCIGVYAVSAMFELCNGGKFIRIKDFYLPLKTQTYIHSHAAFFPNFIEHF